MAEERDRRPCHHYRPGGPPVCWPCHQYRAQVQAGVHQAWLSPEQLADWRRYVQTAQAQGHADMAAIMGHSARQGENGVLVGVSHPGQLPPNYPYPANIDDDIAQDSQTPTQGQPNGQTQSNPIQQASSAQLPAAAASGPGVRMPNGYRGMTSNASQPALKQPPGTSRRTSQHISTGTSRETSQPSRRVRAARISTQIHAGHDQGESSESSDEHA